MAGASRARPFSGHLAPSLLDAYTITRELGRGGCGAVYLATHKSGGDPVAVKLMLSRAQAEPRAIEQFKREMQVIAGLAAAHQEGFVHRDIKPHNILLHRHRAKISDFGLAKNFQKAGLSGMSITGRYAGTPYFMPPFSSSFQRFSVSAFQLLPRSPHPRPPARTGKGTRRGHRQGPRQKPEKPLPRRR